MKKIILVLIILISFQTLQAQISKEKIKDAISEELFAEFTGQTRVQSVDEKSMLIFFKTTEEDYFDRAILVQSENVTPMIDIETEDKCEVFIPNDKRFIIIHNLRNNKVYAVGLNDVIEKVYSVLNKLDSKENFLGFGLSYIVSHFDKSILEEEHSKNVDIILIKSNLGISEQARISAIKQLTMAADSGDRAICNSGGEGSTSCSQSEPNLLTGTTSSCTVSCGAGYYACCRTSTMTCKCVKEGTKERK